MKRVFLTCAGLSVLLSGCGAYLHDASLVGPATTANTRLTQATSLAPFDDQLVKLEAFAGEEDLANASWWAAQRDSEFAALIAQPEWQSGIRNAAATRLSILAPNLDPGLEPIVRALNQTSARQADRRALAVADRQVAIFQIAWANVAPGDSRKTDCTSLRAEITEAGGSVLMQGSTDRDQVLSNLVYACWRTEAYRVRLAALDAALSSAGGGGGQ